MSTASAYSSGPSGPLLADTRSSPFPQPLSFPGKTIQVEALTAAHGPELYETLGRHDSIWTHMTVGPWSSREDFTASLEYFSTAGDVAAYTAFYETQASAILSLRPLDAPSRVIEIGATYAESLQRTRSGTEALYLVLRYAFEGLKSRRVEWKTSSENEASMRAAERYGFAREGRLRNYRIVRGRSRDEILYAMVEGEWPVVQRAFEAWLGESNFDGEGRQRRGLREIRESLEGEGKGEDTR